MDFCDKCENNKIYYNFDRCFENFDEKALKVDYLKEKYWNVTK